MKEFLSKNKNIIKYIMIALNVIFFTVLAIINYKYLSIEPIKINLKFTLSSIFFIHGLINFGYLYLINEKNKLSKLFILLGLFSSMIGDIAIYYNFIVGAIFFGTAHILYVISYMLINKFKLKDLYFILPLFVVCASVLLFSKLINFNDSTMKLVSLVYSLVISIMVGKAISSMFTKFTKFSLVVCIASVLFLTSDIMLVLDLLQLKEWAFVLTGALYFPAQSIFAISLIINNEE
jgi:hypothetical protein